jgi:hypothetical protein
MKTPATDNFHDHKNRDDPKTGQQFAIGGVVGMGTLMAMLALMTMMVVLMRRVVMVIRCVVFTMIMIVRVSLVHWDRTSLSPRFLVWIGVIGHEFLIK